MTDAAQGRAVEIEFAYESIKGADTLVKPFVFFANLEPDVALRVIADFQPALPLDAASLFYAVIGMILGLAAYELLKLPLTVASPGTR